MSFSITNISFPDSIEMDDDETSMKAEPSMNSTLRGITIDSSDENKNADDSIRFNREFDSNEIDENNSHSKKHPKPRISTFLGITID
jgi:hypothetical protein